jgi:membrane-bound lytic murein transglycosylase B
VASAVPNTAPKPLVDPVAPSYANFAEWQQAFRQKALQAGISPATLELSLSGLSPDPSVLAADRSQPEFTRPVWDYLDSAVSPSRISHGRQLQREHDNTLDAISGQYAVESSLLVAIWGMESAYGKNIGNKSVIRSLATLAYAGRRQQFWQEQLLAALKIVDAGDMHAQGLIGSWAGAMGQTQFMPTTYADYAVDFDGDGRRDLWNSSADALASAAHYLQKSGWEAGQPWGFEVSLPAGFDYALADMDIRKSLGEWAYLGVQPLNPPGFTSADPRNASLLLPAGHKGPALLVMQNFRSILRYNNSTSYALAIALLSDQLQGQPPLQGSWPRDEQPLGRSQRVALQEALGEQGFDPGIADGIIGANTRKAVRSYQQSQGLPADGYPTIKLLEQLNKQ